MILWLRLLLGCLIAPATNVSTAVESATPEEDGDPMPICTRNRGPPPAGRPGYRTARSADNGTCPIHLRPVPSRSDPGCRSPEHQQRTTPHASPSDSRRSDQPTETPDRVEQPQATPAPGRFQPERVAGLNRNGWPNSPECTPQNHRRARGCALLMPGGSVGRASRASYKNERRSTHIKDGLLPIRPGVER